MIAILTVVLGALLASLLITSFISFVGKLGYAYLLKRRVNEDKTLDNDNYEGVEWISSEDEEFESEVQAIPSGKYTDSIADKVVERGESSDSYDKASAELLESLREVTAGTVVPTNEPKYKVGDVVITVNPYTSEFAIADFDDTPMYYEVLQVSYDNTDGEFRYYLSGEENWAAESWLDIPEVPVLFKTTHGIKTEPTATVGEDRPPTPKETERMKVAVKAFEDANKKRLIDEYLDMMNSGDPGLRAEGIRLLTILQKYQD